MPQHKNQLSVVIKGRGQAGFSEYEVLKIFCDVCESLAQLHCCQAPIIYRDLKVENVVQNDMGRFILAESGTATTRFLNPVAHGKKAVEEEIQKNTTQAYRAPEMIDLNSGHSITTKGDIWALGCLLYRLCFGALPFGESSKAILHCQYNIPEKCRYSPELCQLIRFLLEADPEKRPNIYQVCEFAFKISGKDNPLRIARERQKSQSLASHSGSNNSTNYTNIDYNERKHHPQAVGPVAPAPISVSTSVAPRSRPKGQHSGGSGSGFNLGPPPLNPSPKNVVSPVPGSESSDATIRPPIGQEKAGASGAPFVANFSDNFPTARSPGGLNVDPQHQAVTSVGEVQRNGPEAGLRYFPSDAKHLLIPPVESSVPKDNPSAVSPASLLSPFEPEPPSSSSSSTRPRPTTLLPTGHHHPTSSSQLRRHHQQQVLSNSNSEKSLVSPVSTTTWNPFGGDSSPFSPNSTLIDEDHLFGAEFDKLRLEGGSQTSIVTSPEEMKSERSSWTRKPQHHHQQHQRFSLPTLTQASSTSVLPSSTAVEVVPEEDPFGSAPFTLPKRVKDKGGRSSKLSFKLSEVIAGAAGAGSLWRHSAGGGGGGGGKESLIVTTPGTVSGENGRGGNVDEGVDKSSLLGIKLDDLISGGEKGSPNLIKLPLDDRNKYEKLNSNDVTSDDSDSEFYPDLAGGVKKQSFKQFVENNIPEKLQAVYHKVDKGQIKNVQIVKKLRGKVETKKGQPKVGRSKDERHVKNSVGEPEGKEGESDDSIGSASDLRANDEFPEGEEGDVGRSVAGKPVKKLNRMAFGDGSVDDCISESIKTCGSSAYHAECESVTTNEDNCSRIVTRVRIKKREHDSKHSVIDEDDSGEEDRIHGDKPLLLDDELDYESAPENNTSGEEVLMDPFTPESLPDESEKLTEEDEVDLDPFAMAPFKKPAVPKRNSIKYTPNVNPIPENCPTMPAPSLPPPPPPPVDNFCTSTPIKPARSQQPGPIDPPPPPPSAVPPIAAPESVPFHERSPNARGDLFGLEPFPPLVLSPPKPAVRHHVLMEVPSSIPTVTVQPGSVALTHIIPPNTTMAALPPMMIPVEPVPAPAPPPPIPSKPRTPPSNHHPAIPMNNARSSYINFGQMPKQGAAIISSFSPDNNYVNFQADFDDDDDVRKLKSDDYDDSSDNTAVKSSSKSGGFLSKKEKVKYNSLKDHKSTPSKDDSSNSMPSGSGSAGNHSSSIIPVKLSQKVKVNVGGYKKVSSKASKKEKSNGSSSVGSERYEENSTKSAKACKQMGFSNMSFEDFPSDEAIEEEHRAGAQRHGPFEVIRNERTLLEAEKKFGSLKRRSNPFS